MKKLLLVSVAMLMMTGCVWPFTNSALPQATVQGTKLLSKGYAGLSKDFTDLDVKFKLYMDVDQSDKAKLDLKRSYITFRKGFKASEIAIKAHVKAILELEEK